VAGVVSIHEGFRMEQRKHDEIQRESIEIANQGTEWGVKKGKRF
jgi:hypothetical protein